MPGIVIQHARLPDRNTGLVRGDIAGIIGFIPKVRWPEGAASGDFVEVLLRREGDLWAHPDRGLFDPASRRAVRAFFDNGGDVCHLFGVCIEGEDDITAPSAGEGVLAPLLHRLRTEEDIALLAVPAAAYLRCELSRDGSVRCLAESLYDELLQHCREMTNRFLVIDAPRGLHAEPLERWVRDFRDRHPKDRSYGALYYPWLMQGDELFPPSGAVMGTYARVELEHAPFGVGWPPANTPLRGVTHTEFELDWQEAGDLADQHINPIVVQQGRGVVVFGSRTLSRDPSFAQVNSRRIVNVVAEQLRRDSDWAVFETNNPHLWDVLERDVRVRLGEFWSAGLLTGARAGEDYDVTCSPENNPAHTRDAGQVNVLIRLRPVGATEQILIDLRLGGES
ncbi:MAG: phage tail sheath family protein [Alphaproteobacteria bacterium]|nr:phage tail sheath family protein [Alphaproteobacteria bacterium]